MYPEEKRRQDLSVRLLRETSNATQCEGHADMLYYTRWVVVFTLYISLFQVPEHVASCADLQI